MEGKGLVVGAFTNVLVSSTSSKHVQQAFFDRVGDGGRVLRLSFGEQQVEDVGRVQLSGWVVGGVTWAEGSVRVNAKWCKNSIEVSGFSGVGGSLSGGDRLEGSRPDVGGVGPVVLVRHAERIGPVHVDVVDQRISV